MYSYRAANIHRTWALMTAFLLLVIGIGFVVSQVTGNPFVLYIAIAISISMNAYSYWFSDKVALSVSKAKPITKEQYPDLYNVVENLSITAGLPMPKVHVIEDSAMNAFATGRNPQNAAVAATTGLLKSLSKAELEGVMAHELGHVQNRDILVSSVAVVLAGFVSIVAEMFLRGSGFGRGRSKEGGNIWILVLGFVFMLLAPLFARMMTMAISRRREYLADTSGALLTRYPEGLASALEKIHEQNQPLQRASNATAHLFIANPFGAKKKIGGGISALFSTHPPAQDRIRILREMDVDSHGH